jgi:RNA polymerase sigma factor (sigma-70 family)
MSPLVSARLLLTQSDARLAAFARAGHERAFEALVQRYRRPLLGYCRRLLLSQERAEDALQQALLQAWLALRAGTEVGEVKPWLYRIVHNAALNALRVSGYDYRQLNESLSGAGAPQEDLDRRIAVREALAGLAALPQMQREALLRTAVEGRTHQDVARDLGLSESALRGLVYRARATLRAAAGAIVPPPLVSWALESSGSGGAPVVERLAELGASGGSAGVAGLLMKGGAVAVTASVLAGGITAVRAHPKAAHPNAPSHIVHRAASRSGATPVASADARTQSATPIATGRRVSSHAGRHAPSRAGMLHVHQPPSRPSQPASQPSVMPFTTRVPSPPRPPSSDARHHDGIQEGRSDDSHSHDEAQRFDSSGPGGNAPTTHHGDGSRDTGPPEQSSGGGGSSPRDQHDGGSSGESTSASSDGRHASSGDGQGDGTQGRSQPGESSGRQESSGASSSTSTNSKSKDGHSSTPEPTKED